MTPLARARMQQILWDLPLVSNTDVTVALGLSQSTWQVMKLEGSAPPCVMIGRRVFYRPVDLRKWIAGMEAKKNPVEEDGVLEEQAA